MIEMFVKPMRLLRIPEPLDHPDWFFELKLEASARSRASRATSGGSSRATATR